MKKILIAVVEFCLVFLVLASPAFAMTVGDPGGTKISGWFKDNFSVSIAHGTTGVLGLIASCSGSGTSWQYTYTSNASGTHTYAFYADSKDDPYLKFDGGSYQSLDNTCSGSSPSGSPIKQFAASIDSQAPFVSITTPTGSVSTSDANYDVSGITGDVEGNLKTVQAYVNGAAVSTATVSGSTFSVRVPIKTGANNIQMVATDVVGHTTNSNTVTITGSTSGSSSGGGSGGSSGGGGSGNNSKSSSGSGNSSSSGQSSSQPLSLLFDQQKVIGVSDTNSDNKASDPTDVQATAALSGATGIAYDSVIGIIVILVALCGFVIYRFRPMFAELNHDQPGLRRKLLLIVTLPSLLPLLGLGYLGYLQLSDSVKSQLSDQLEKAAQTSAIKLNREFNIRSTVISKTANDILQIQSQYQDLRTTLDKQKASCQQLINTNVPSGLFSKVTGNVDCLKFSEGIAQVASFRNANVTDYSNALNQGADLARQHLTDQENKSVNELLASVRNYFPDVLELIVTDNSKDGNIEAILPRKNPNQPTLAETHKDLLAQASKQSLALFDPGNSGRQLILTYPIKNGSNIIGGAAVAIDTTESHFIPTILKATPIPYDSDRVYLVSTQGELISPQTKDKVLQGQAKSLAATSPSNVFNLKVGDQTYATRTSPVNNTKWVVAVAAPGDSLLAPLAGIQRTAILAIVGFLLLSLLLGIWFISSVVSEIRHLFQGALVFAKGDLDYRINLDTHDELQVLGDTMNKMAADIKAAQTALVEKDKEFINIATHELKAPMTAIIGYLSMIIDDGMGKVDDTANRFIREAYSGVIRLRDLVTDLLDIARMESGHAQFNLEPLDIVDMTKMVIDMQKLPSEQANVSLAHKSDGKLPKVMADKNKLQIIVTNFVSNAIKYNRKGGTVTVAHEVKDGQLVTSVTDTGLGIPLDQQSKIFEKFYRVKHDDRANVPGTGLGMYITKQFIENMGGKVWFESVHGKGTTFYFSLPVEGSAAQTTTL